jgi:hypothetical protein
VLASAGTREFLRRAGRFLGVSGEPGGEARLSCFGIEVPGVPCRKVLGDQRDKLFQERVLTAVGVVAVLSRRHDAAPSASSLAKG